MVELAETDVVFAIIHSLMVTIFLLKQVHDKCLSILLNSISFQVMPRITGGFWCPPYSCMASRTRWCPWLRCVRWKGPYPNPTWNSFPWQDTTSCMTSPKRWTPWFRNSYKNTCLPSEANCNTYLSLYVTVWKVLPKCQQSESPSTKGASTSISI